MQFGSVATTIMHENVAQRRAPEYEPWRLHVAGLENQNMQQVAEIIGNAARAGIAVPSFNVPYLTMVEPVIRAVCDTDSFALVATARLEWTKFESHGPAAVIEEFARWDKPEHVRLHLDHVPVIDEDNLRVDYLTIIKEALDRGYHSVMVDGSRLKLQENIEATRRAVDEAHKAGVPCEAELGAVLGHEAGPLPPYEELFESGRGFTDPDEAARFVSETGCDWLSVAVGSVHGAVSGAMRDKKKVEARLDLDHLERLREVTQIPLVLHGGSGVNRESVLAGTKRGISKVNVGTDIRQVYEAPLRESAGIAGAQDAVYDRTVWLIREYFGLAGTKAVLNP